jgi:hypothetical protein
VNGIGLTIGGRLIHLPHFQPLYQESGFAKTQRRRDQDQFAVQLLIQTLKQPPTCDQMFSIRGDSQFGG